MGHRWLERLIFGAYLTLLFVIFGSVPWAASQIAQFIRISGLVSVVRGDSNTWLVSVGGVVATQQSGLQSVAGQVDLKTGALISIGGVVTIQQNGLQSVAGQVDVKSGALISVSRAGNDVQLTSILDSGWDVARLTSMMTKAWGTRLDSMSLVAGAAGTRIAVYKFSGTLESLVSSYGFYSTNPGSTKLFGALPLYSQEFIAGGGIAETALCTAVKCKPIFLASVGDDLMFAATSNGNEGRVRIGILLYSYER